MSNKFHDLRLACLARSTRPFLARGKSVQRCAACQLAQSACICPWKIELSTNVDFVLLLHHDEIFKPTNTGRLIADILPNNTFVFEWSRTQPPSELLALLQEPSRYPVIVFPAEDDGQRVCHTEMPQMPADKRLTFIVLDGTWRQASRMFRSSPWLSQIPALSLPAPEVGAYAVRQAIRDGQLATAEAAALLLELAGETKASAVLSDYFLIFNTHYLATRGCTPVIKTEVHERLDQLKHA